MFTNALTDFSLHCGFSFSFWIDSLANSEDPDEMQYKKAFHQALHCSLRK